MSFLISLKIINLRNASSKIILFAVFLTLTIILFTFAKWCFANSIVIQSRQNNISEFAINLAPSDPQTHYCLATLSENTFLPEGLEKSLTECETATSLSPHDYRLWLALGKAFERNGRFAEADAAFIKTLKIAPNYSQVYWVYGNFLLRRGKTEEGFAKIRRAAETNIEYQKQVVSIARRFFSDNLDEIRKNLEVSPAIDSEIALFLIEKKRFDEALKIWNTFSAKDKKTRFKELGKLLFDQMISTKKFRDALEIQNQIAADGEVVLAAEQISNGSFEKDIKTRETTGFYWQLDDNPQPRAGFDEGQKSDGNRSLVFLFNSANSKDFPNLSQMIVIEPGKNYKLSFYYKAELKTLAAFRWQVSGVSNRVLAETENLSNNTDWKKIDLSFKTPVNTEVIKINLASQFKCLQGRCPIYGKIWFDDFQLIKQPTN